MFYKVRHIRVRPMLVKIINIDECIICFHPITLSFGVELCVDHVFGLHLIWNQSLVNWFICNVAS